MWQEGTRSSSDLELRFFRSEKVRRQGDQMILRRCVFEDVAAQGPGRSYEEFDHQHLPERETLKH